MEKNNLIALTIKVLWKLKKVVDTIFFYQYNIICYEDEQSLWYLQVVGMVKRLTRRIVAPLCVGSIPTTHPTTLYLSTGVSPSGKATDFDSVMRWFDPSHPCQHDSLAQLAEHLTFNQGVPRSSRGWVTKLNSQTLVCEFSISFWGALVVIKCNLVARW